VMPHFIYVKKRVVFVTFHSFGKMLSHQCYLKAAFNRKTNGNIYLPWQKDQQSDDGC
jgi:hypothetical protein